MVLVRWLTGDLEVFNGPITVAELRSQIRSRYGRNQVVQIINADLNNDDDDHTLSDEEQVHVIVVPEKEMRSDEHEKVANSFRDHFNYISPTFFDIFRDMVKTTGALVAGGSVVCALVDEEINDFDVYVHYSKAFDFIRQLMNVHKFFSRSWQVHTGSIYDESFFRRNHILLRVPLLKRISRQRRDNRRYNHQVSQEIQIDVLVIPDAIPLEQVVTNFDLSFCETWWDGEKVRSEDADGVRLKHGTLKPDYWKCLFRDLNWFTVGRVRKYRRRGFRVDLCDNLEITLADLARGGTDREDDDKEDREDDREDREEEDDGKEDDDKEDDDKEDDAKEEKQYVDSRMEDWSIRKFYTGALQLFQRGNTTHIYGLQEIAFFFKCFPNQSVLTYQSLVDKWRDSGSENLLHKLIGKVFSEQWSELRNMPPKYGEAYLATFGLTASPTVDYDHNEFFTGWNDQEWKTFWSSCLDTMMTVQPVVPVVQPVVPVDYEELF